MDRPSRREFLRAGVLGAGAGVAGGSLPARATSERVGDAGVDRSGGRHAPAVSSPAGAWTQFQGDSGHSGYAPDRTGPTTGVEERWAFETDGAMSVENAPVVADGVVVAGSRDHRVYGIDLETGERRWSRDTGDRVVGSAAVAGDTVFVGSDTGVLSALSLQTGAERWRYEIENHGIQHRPTVVGDAVVLEADGLVALDAETGERRWRAEHSVSLGVAASARTETVFAGDNGSDRVYAYDLTDGTTRWERRIDGRTATKHTLTAAERTVFVGDDAGVLHALEGIDGATRWRFDTGGGRLFSSPAVADGVAYVGSGWYETADSPHHLYALDVATGEVEWRFQAPEAVFCSPVVAGGVCYFGGVDGRVYALDAADGELMWEFDLGEQLKSSLAVVSGALVCNTSAGAVYALTEPTDAEPTPRDEERTSGWSPLALALAAVAVSAAGVAHHLRKRR